MHHDVRIRLLQVFEAKVAGFVHVPEGLPGVAPLKGYTPACLGHRRQEPYAGPAEPSRKSGRGLGPGGSEAVAMGLLHFLTPRVSL